MKTSKKQLLVIGAVIIIAVVYLFLTFYMQPKTLSGEEFMSKYQTTPGAVLIDVRTPEEFADGNLKESINLNLQGESFFSEVSVLNPNKTYFIYCRSGGRSRAAGEIMRQAGLNVYELEGGLVGNPGLLPN
jgi:rhodanese-related sulfurtransferase